MSDITKGKKIASLITGILSFLLSIGPAIYFVSVAFVNGEIKQKMTIGALCTIVLILTVIMWLTKYNLRRTIFWILVFGIFIVADKLAVMFIVMGVCNIIDEVIMTPLHRSFKTSYKTNKEIDKRMGVK